MSDNVNALHDLRDRAQRAGINAYYDYLQTLHAKAQDEPWAVTNAILSCVNAAIAVVQGEPLRCFETDEDAP